MGLIGELVNDISGAIESGLNILGLASSSKTYPATLGSSGVSVNAVTNHITDYKTKDWKESRGYAFQVYRVARDGGSEKASPIGDWKEFRLQINPQELQQDEIFAIEVTPTLRGVMVEHHGTILKDIVLSGTTGISPMRREGGALFNDGSPIFQKGHSGYQEFQELRSYFRVYVESKRLDQRDGGELRMVFKNFKDNEFLYVEPQKFTMKRSSTRPHLYDYSIALKGIGAANQAIKAEPKGLIASIDDALDSAQGYLDTGVQVINASIGIISRTERNIASTILAPIQALDNAITAIKGGKALLFGEFGITRRSIDSIKREVEKVEANFADSLGRDMGAFNAASGRTSTIVGTSGRQSTYQELQLMNALGALKKGLVTVSGQSALFDQDVFAANRTVADQFRNKFQIQTPNSVRTKRILGDDNIQSIAARELGDPDRYRDIVILNNLRPPYIAATASPGVLQPGDNILIPQQNPNTSTGVTQGRVYNITKFMQESEKNLGTDIRIDKNGDLAVSNAKDLDLLAGIENMVQAIGIRLYIEKGGLKRHLTIGTDLQVGVKLRKGALQEIREQIVSSFSSDPRIDSIPFIQLTQEASTTKINMLLKLRDLEQPVPVPISLNG
jgi:hypothetical protein